MGEDYGNRRGHRVGNNWILDSLMRKLTVSFGGIHQARIERVEQWTWEQFSTWLTDPAPIAADKAERGWYIPAEFSPVYRDSDNFVARHAITFDFDRVPEGTEYRALHVWKELAFAMYPTFSNAAGNLRFRVVMPLSRPATYDEFQAVARKVAADIGIELVARESFIPAQMMYAPTRREGSPEFISVVNDGAWLDVDGVLAEYENWTDHKQWPHRVDGDSVHAIKSEMTPPNEKPGIVGDFCRAFSVAAAIERFELPYKPTATEGRWTYTAGSRPEGAIEYDSGLKFHSHHDTDPARGQNNAFDLVRLHKFGALDEGRDRAISVTDRPSFKAMVEFARSQPELQEAIGSSEFEDLGPLTENETLEKNGARAFARRLCDVLNSPTVPEWLIEDVIERGILGILAGPRGSYKSFIALDWAMRIATREGAEPVYVVSAEGGDFDRRAAAWLRHFLPERAYDSIPLFVVERRLDLSNKAGVETIRQDCLQLNIKPALFVLDTFSKLSGGLEENDNSEVKQFIGLLDNGLKRADTGFGATVLLIAHTGHGDASRARGASALAADTDAEYIVSRNLGDESVNVTRERFKSSPELPPLCYKPNPVTLQHTDKTGRAATSLVMLPAEPPQTARSSKKKVTAPNQRLVLDVLRTMSAGGSVNQEDLIEGVKTKLPKPEGRDIRRRTIERALTALCASGVVFMQGEDRVSLTNIAEVGEEEWLQ